MLNNAKEGERIGLDGDVYEQVASACRGARPKIQKWIEDDNGEKAEMMGESAAFSSSCQIDYYYATISSTTLSSDMKLSKLETGLRHRESSKRG